MKFFWQRNKKSISNETVMDLHSLSSDLLNAKGTADENLSAVFKCVDLISDSIAKVPFFVYDTSSSLRLSDGRYKSISRLLKTMANSYETPFQFKKHFMRLLLLDGQVFIYPEWGNDGKSIVPIALYVLPKKDVTINRNSLTENIVFSFTFKGQSIKALPNEIINLMCFTDDGFTGYSPLTKAQQTTDTSKLLDSFQTEFYSKSGRPTGTLEVPNDLSSKEVAIGKDSNGNPIMASEKDAVKLAWEEHHSHGSGVAVLDNGMKYSPIAPISPKDMDFVSNKELQIADIGRYFKVPMSKLGVGKSTYSTREQEAIEYVNEAVVPYADQICEQFSNALLLPSDAGKGIIINTDTDVEVLADVSSRGTYYKNMLSCGAMTPNEIRRAEEIGGALAGGDEPRFGPNVLTSAMQATTNSNKSSSDFGTDASDNKGEAK